MGGGGGARWAQVLGEDDYRVSSFPRNSLGFLCFMYVGACWFRWAGPLEASGLISMQKPRMKIQLWAVRRAEKLGEGICKSVIRCGRLIVKLYNPSVPIFKGIVKGEVKHNNICAH